MDQLSLKTLKSHIDQIISHINNSLNDIKTPINGQEQKVYSKMEAQLQDYIKSTQLEFERERSALLKRCLVAEKKLEAISKSKDNVYSAAYV